uniref:Uncharacterized protein n=1 Tax=Schistocephalus solidus TaxID=70667 RepID=A0A0X3PLN7_SCHSO
MEYGAPFTLEFRSMALTGPGQTQTNTKHLNTPLLVYESSSDVYPPARGSNEQKVVYHPTIRPRICLIAVGKASTCSSTLRTSSLLTNCIRILMKFLRAEYLRYD